MKEVKIVMGKREVRFHEDEGERERERERERESRNFLAFCMQMT